MAHVAVETDCAHGSHKSEVTVAWALTHKSELALAVMTLVESRSRNHVKNQNRNPRLRAYGVQ